MPNYDSARRGCSWRRVDLHQCARGPMCDGGVQSGNPPNSLCVRRTRTPLKLGPRLAYMPRPELFGAVEPLFPSFSSTLRSRARLRSDEEHPAAITRESLGCDVSFRPQWGRRRRWPTQDARHASCEMRDALPPAPRRRWPSAAFPALATRPTHPLSNHAICLRSAGSLPPRSRFKICLLAIQTELT